MADVLADTLWTNMTQGGENGSVIGDSCCFTDPKKVKTTAIVYCCTSILSIFGAGSIIIYSMWKKIVNSPEVQPLFHLAVANFLLAVTSVIGVILWFAKPTYKLPVDCFYLNCIEETFFVISFFLTVNYGINVYIRLKERTFKLHNLLFTTVSTDDFYTWTFRGLYLASWIIPVAIIIPLIVKFIEMGDNKTKPSLFCSRCLFLFDHPKFPRNSTEIPWAMYNSLMLILSLALSIFSLLILYYMTERIYKKTLMHSGYHTNKQRSSMANMRKRIVLFILVFIICWFPAFVIACIDLHKLFNKSSALCDRPYIIQALTAPLQGFLNSIVYGWTRKTFRTAATRQRLIDDSSMQVQTYGSSTET